MYELGKRIRYFRERAGLSQKKFAQQINMKNTTVSNWEQGVSRPNADILADICLALSVSPSELLDIRLLPDELNDKERSVIMAYRTKPELQQAVDILLGVHKEP